MSLLDPTELQARSTAMEGAAPPEILRFALATWPKTAISTAFGPEGCALIHMAIGIRPDIPVFTVDTGWLFQESIDLRQKFVEKYGIRLTVLEGQTPLIAQDKLHGPRLFERDTDLCCALRKVEPTDRALDGLDAWIAGLRRDQGKSRAGIDLFERYEHKGAPLVKVNPLATWTRKDTWDYLLKNEVPYNALLDQGYKSIGCWPCTAAVGEGGDERGGRWGGRKEECGIHTFMARKT
ncbi:MAG: phosphoadenylyl-sulfate reductase [Myxococcales bacterium]|nr:phosphoadenylyl-sulfate reductase [Myxococcales bacterium]